MVYSLPHVFPLTVHLDDLGDLSDTQGYSGPVSHSCTPTQTLRKLWDGVVVLANKILVTSLKSRASVLTIWDLGLGWAWTKACQ